MRDLSTFEGKSETTGLKPRSHTIYTRSVPRPSSIASRHPSVCPVLALFSLILSTPTVTLRHQESARCIVHTCSSTICATVRLPYISPDRHSHQISEYPPSLSYSTIDRKYKNGVHSFRGHCTSSGVYPAGRVSALSPSVVLRQCLCQ